MITVLGIAPGSMTPLALMNDSEKLVTCVLDATLLEATQINFHPLVQTRSIALHSDQLLAFLESCGHPPVLLVPGERQEASGEAQRN